MYKRLIKNVDFPIIATAAALLLFSLMTIGSATLEFSDSTAEGVQKMNIFFRLLHLDPTYVLKQMAWIFLGLIAAATLLYIDYEDIIKYSNHLYILNLLMLIAVIFLGTTALGAQRWIYIGPFSFQPSEFSKLIIVICFANFLAKRQGRLNNIRELIPCFAYVGLPMLIILKQPDLGTSLVFVAILFGMLFVAGARTSILVGIITLGLVMGFSIYETHEILHNSDKELKEKVALVSKAAGGNDFALRNNEVLRKELEEKGYSLNTKELGNYLEVIRKDQQQAEKRHKTFHSAVLKEYQMTRLTIFANPESDLLGAGYHVWQSRIAIGSGGPMGKGLLRGTQSHYTFLPIRHTDFIFSVVGEEFGFIGAVVLLGLFYVLLHRGVRIILGARDIYGSLLAAGIVSMFVFHIFLNIGMTTGIMPVAGIPLPFFSYGGSNIIMNLASLGLLLNVHVRRQKLIF